jgi:hypothetical protein
MTGSTAPLKVSHICRFSASTAVSGRLPTIFVGGDHGRALSRTERSPSGRP